MPKRTPANLLIPGSGIGNPQHLSGELLEEVAGIKSMRVPYKGASGQLVDVVAGNVDMTFVSYSGAKGFIQKTEK
jgi:tripartite-type tricarboxylate transporter receptor subunit TctC